MYSFICFNPKIMFEKKFNILPIWKDTGILYFSVSDFKLSPHLTSFSMILDKMNPLPDFKGFEIGSNVSIQSNPTLQLY